uniref:NADH-ubiquinone oxidoreductase chain 6 n=1 Tax=Ablepharus himalayanus TaxID=3147705 RepID=A0A8E5KI44_9SAUR|nr:NADH dehydrogenase subunit 6 [Asymblepharus himalayanus]QVH34651.1 NADH dehydrogenase subunit 6 [Asymblepharus himalayanus]
MVYFVFLFSFCLLGGLVGVASNPSPLYGAVGLVVASAVGCGVLVWLGCSFVSLVLFLIYLGGMLVVFAYSVALAADSYPETWGSWFVGMYVIGYVGLVLLFSLLLGWVWVASGVGVVGSDSVGMGLVRVDFSGVALLYSCGGMYLLLSGWGLLVALFVALELSRGLVRGSLRVV